MTPLESGSFAQSLEGCVIRIGLTPLHLHNLFPQQYRCELLMLPPCLPPFPPSLSQSFTPTLCKHLQASLGLLGTLAAHNPGDNVQ